jgi:hypothetical protein
MTKKCLLCTGYSDVLRFNDWPVTYFNGFEYFFVLASGVKFDSIEDLLRFAATADSDVYNDIAKHFFTQPVDLLKRILDASDVDFKQNFLEVAVDSKNAGMVNLALWKGASLCGLQIEPESSRNKFLQDNNLGFCPLLQEDCINEPSFICQDCSYTVCESCHSNIRRCPGCRHPTMERKDVPTVPSAAEIIHYAEEGTHFQEIFKFVSFVRKPDFPWTQLFLELVEKVQPFLVQDFSLNDIKKSNILFKLKRKEWKSVEKSFCLRKLRAS